MSILRNKGDASDVVVGLIAIAIGLAGAVGWVLNIYKLIGSSFDHITGLLICRVIGIFVAPLGAIVGYF